MRAYNAVYSQSLINRELLNVPFDYEVYKERGELSRIYGIISADGEYLQSERVTTFIDNLYKDHTAISTTYDGKEVLYNLCVDLDAAGWKGITDFSDAIHKSYNTVCDNGGTIYKVTLYYAPRGECAIRRHDIIDLKNILNIDLEELIPETQSEYVLRHRVGAVRSATRRIEHKLAAFGCSVLGGANLTASQISKRYWLTHVFDTSYEKALDLFHKFFGLTNAQDAEFRRKELYKGGRLIINPRYLNQTINKVYRADVRSMYPSIMAIMLYPRNNYVGIDAKDFHEGRILSDHVYLYHIQNLVGVLKAGKVPVYTDTLTDQPVELIREYNELYLWREELDELAEWYDLDYELLDVLDFPTHRLKRVKEVEEYAYLQKKLADEKFSATTWKIIINGISGKMGQPAYGSMHKLVDGELVDKELDVDLNAYAPMSIVIASRITMLGTVKLLSTIRRELGKNIARDFVYSATDSIFSLKPITTGGELGDFADKGIAEKMIVRAPNFYMFMDANSEIKVRCSGIHNESVQHDINTTCATWDEAVARFNFGEVFDIPMLFKFKNGKKRVLVRRPLLKSIGLREFKQLFGDMEEV